jgi:damage-control phosphatase, subfamily III
MSHRVPIIITNVVDQLTREKEKIIAELGEQSREELKSCIGEISKLKYELQTDKPMLEIPGDESDQYEWNNLLKEIEPNNSYFSAVWLYAECYLYRRLKSIFAETQTLKDFDYFENSKKLELKNSCSTIARVLKSVKEFNASSPTKEQVGDFFCKLLKVNLWGNRNDLSITLGKEIEQVESDPVSDVETFNKELLVDNTREILNCLYEGTSDAIVDIINDNSGYELLCDFVLADFIIHHKLAKIIRFRVKAIPWFISDVLPKDFKYTMDELKKHETSILNEAGIQWENYMNSGKFVLVEPTDHFFTSPFEYYKMEKIAPQLYRSIAESHLAIIKGDLNYRKLLADINWDPTTDFRTSLSGFEPTNLCALRTVKADLISGLEPGVAEELWEKEGSQWMATGKYGVIQFASKIIFKQ